MSKMDRAVQALFDNGWEGQWDDPITIEDLADAAALVVRVVRDDLILAWRDGQINDLLGAERLLNERIVALTGRPTITGDTTEATEPEPADDTLDSLTALVTVDERGRLTPESTVTVGEFTWPVPERTERAGVLAGARIQAALREHGYTMVPGRQPVDGPEAGVYEVPVRKIETNET